MPDFRTLFGVDVEASASAPGRVNLLGEHTDYNDGLVMPIAIPRQVHTELARSRDGRHRFHSEQFPDDVDLGDGEAAPRGYARYVQGCIEVLRQRGHEVPPLWVRIDSQVPIGAGLSSSAALEVSVLRAVRSLLSLRIDDVEIALAAQQAEHRYAGVMCGILDQMASSLAGTDRLLYLDTRSLERRVLPLPAETALCVIDSGVSRELSGSGYNQRRAECQEAARLLGVGSLRDVDDPSAVLKLPPPLDRRARHVLSENDRVRAAAAGVDAATFGALMNASHRSLSVDYEVSVPALDELAAALAAHPAVFGAKLTGAGFGGACVALTRRGASRDVAAQVLERFAAVHPGARTTLTE